MKKRYHAPEAYRILLTYEAVYAKRCHFADYQECSPSDTQYK